MRNVGRLRRAGGRLDACVCVCVLLFSWAEFDSDFLPIWQCKMQLSSVQLHTLASCEKSYYCNYFEFAARFTCKSVHSLCFALDWGVTL